METILSSIFNTRDNIGKEIDMITLTKVNLHGLTSILRLILALKQIQALKNLSAVVVIVISNMENLSLEYPLPPPQFMTIWDF